MPDAKPCTKCGEAKPIDDYYRDRTKPDGRESRCKTCAAEYQRQHREKNRDKVLEREQRYYEKNRDKVLERKRQYHEKNRDRELERKRRFYEDNREYCKRSATRYKKETQGNSALTATRKGKPWTPADDDILTADDGRNLFAKALLLGRTYASCAARRNRLNHPAEHPTTT